MGRTKSIMQTVDECYVCRCTGNLEVHHALHGTANRRIADREGLFVKLCPAHHRGEKGVHGRDGADLDLYIKQMAQRAYEETHSRDEWMGLFGKNYL